MIRLAEEGLGGKIVERRAGGKDGGGASITERGRRLTELYQRYEEAVREFSEKKYGEIDEIINSGKIAAVIDKNI